MDFPAFVSFTLTNHCNLRCRMCGQWSEEGYIRAAGGANRRELDLADWKRLAEEAAAHDVRSVLLRGGEPFLFPGIIDLLEHLHGLGLFVSIDTNGTLLRKYAADLLRIGQIHITISIDGTEKFHDSVRGVPGTFRCIRAGVEHLAALERETGRSISKSLTFTISGYNYRSLGALPDIARSLAIGTVCIVPFYYVPERMGREYEREMRAQFNCAAFSWRGFHHEESGVELEEFQRQLDAYHRALGDLMDYPYMPLTPAEYRTWFGDAAAPAGNSACGNVERLIDIQPSGDANFCVDFPDYSIGNVRNSTIEELWNSPAAEAFRTARRRRPFAVCHRCGAKFMSVERG